jgi:hypothetical protein
MVLINTIVFYVMRCLVVFLKTMFSKTWYSRYYEFFKYLKLHSNPNFRGMPSERITKPKRGGELGFSKIPTKVKLQA